MPESPPSSTFSPTAHHQKPKILVFTNQFPPGFKGGGPICSLVNLIDHCRNNFDFYVITRDRDLHESAPYSWVKIDEWQEAYSCKVIYLSPSRWSFRSFRNYISSTPHEIIYLNSFFSISTIKILVLRKLGMLPKNPLLLTPRGEFLPGALRISRGKYLKKILFINLSKLIGLYKGVMWQATNESEKQHISQHFKVNPIVATNLPPKLERFKVTGGRTIAKSANEASFIFLSRIVVKKNLDFALQLLQQVKGHVVFDIYGPLEDKKYWKKCDAEIKRLPSNVVAKYCGQVSHEEVPSIFGKHHFFFFPTRSENFGHVILESIAAGCPVIVSDQTPWRGLERQGAGWDIPLADKEGFIRIIQRCIEMDSKEFDTLSQSTHELGVKLLNNEKAIAQNCLMFEVIIRCKS